jgi:hypothetical protein
MKNTILFTPTDASIVTMGNELKRGVNTIDVALSQHCSTIPMLTIQVKEFRSIS